MLRIDVTGSGKTILLYEKYLKKLFYAKIDSKISEVAYHNPAVKTVGSFIIKDTYYPAESLEIVNFRNLVINAKCARFHYVKQRGKLYGRFITCQQVKQPLETRYTEEDVSSAELGDYELIEEWEKRN